MTAKIITITGGKGGTGKSTVAISLATQLSQTNNRVLLVDADVDCPNTHLILGIKLKSTDKVYQRLPVFNLDKCTQCAKCGPNCLNNALVSIKSNSPILIENQCNGCGACKIICEHNAITWGQKQVGEILSGNKDNLNILVGELKSKERISELIVNELNKVMESAKYDYDYIIIDSAAGTHCPVIAAFKNSTQIIAVTEPTPLGLHDLRQILQVIKILDKNADIIINKSDLGNITYIEELAKEFSSEIIFSIPYSKEIITAYSNQKPITIPELEGVLK